MAATLISCIALVLTIIGATWKLSSLISPLIEAVRRLDDAMSKLSSTITEHGADIAVLTERTDRVEDDISKLSHRIDNAA